VRGPAPDWSSAPWARDTGGVRLLRVSPTTFRWLSLAAVVAIVGLVATGGWVRVSESGLGCPTWPKCTGASVVAPASSYHAWVEFSNRCLITLIAVLIGVLVVTALAARPRRRELVVLSLGLLVGYVAEAVLGGITVLAKLNPALVAGHLVLALALLSDAVALHWLASHPGPLAKGRFGLPELRPRVGRGVLLGARLLAVCFWVTVVLGTVVTGTGPYSGQHGTPRFGFTILSTVLAHGGSGLVFGGVVLATVVLLGATGAPRDVQRRLWVAAALLGVQGALGASVYLTHFRAGLIEAHVIGAAVLLVALFRYTLGLYEPVPAPAPVAEPTGAWAPVPVLGLSGVGSLRGGRSQASRVESPPPS
jgi:cytochrome c oxidase assembly protein subunit 15